MELDPEGVYPSRPSFKANNDWIIIMPNVNITLNTDNILWFYTLKGSLIQLIDNQLLLEDGHLIPYISPDEAYDEYHHLLDNERDLYLNVRESD